MPINRKKGIMTDLMRFILWAVFIAIALLAVSAVIKFLFSVK